MMIQLQAVLEEALQKYSGPEAMPLLMEAKKEYIEKTGKVDEDDADFEASINSFYDWYLLQFLSPKRTITLIKEFCLEKKFEKETIRIFQSVNHSIFEYLSTAPDGRQQLRDVLHNYRFYLPANHLRLGVIPGDFFISRSLLVRSEVLMCQGLLVLPKEIKKFLYSYCKVLRREHCKVAENTFLLNVEKMRNKVKSFGHVGALNVYKQSGLF